MTIEKFKGTGVAIVTPFQNGMIDFPALSRSIAHVINGGVDFIVSLGTTGESTALSQQESQEILRFTVAEVAGRVPLVAGMFGANSTSLLLERLDVFADVLGCFDAVMSSSPAYVRPTQEGIFQHYMAFAKASPLPIILYNVPGRTASNMTAETVVRLANASEKFVAVKEASGNMEQAQRIIKEKPGHLLVLSGDDLLTLGLIAGGADGGISVIANAFPAQFSQMVRAALAGDFANARRLQYLLYDVHPLLYVDGNPPGIKATMEILGLCSREVRLPLVPVRENIYSDLKKVIERDLSEY